MFGKMGQKMQNMPFLAKLGHFTPKWHILHFLAHFLKHLIKCHTPLESVNFFWLIETLKSKIHFFPKKIYKGSPLWILGEMSATMKAFGVTSHYFKEKISSQFILVMWMSRKTNEPKIFENFSKIVTPVCWHSLLWLIIWEPGRRHKNI